MSAKLLENRAISLFVLAILLLAISFPRFNQRDIGFKGITGGSGITYVSDGGTSYENLCMDNSQYLLLVKYFRSIDRVGEEELIPPFSYRPLTSAIASLLPFDEMTSLNVINLISLLIALIILESVITGLGLNNMAKNLSLLMFVVSFPVFYYATIGYIDPMLIMFLSIGLKAILRKHWGLFQMVIFIGVFAKEGVAILLPLALFTEFENKREKIVALVNVGIGFILYFAATFIARSLFDTQNQYLWMPSAASALANLSRFRAVFSIGITIALPGAIAMLAINRWLMLNDDKHRSTYRLLTVGCIMSVAYCLYGFSSVRADGRYIWPAYVFCVPLSALYFDSIFRGKVRQLIK